MLMHTGCYRVCSWGQHLYRCEGRRIEPRKQLDWSEIPTEPHPVLWQSGSGMALQNCPSLEQIVVNTGEWTQREGTEDRTPENTHAKGLQRWKVFGRSIEWNEMEKRPGKSIKIIQPGRQWKACFCRGSIHRVVWVYVAMLEEPKQ